jgi:putative nucleotidyltransferase-like protein
VLGTEGAREGGDLRAHGRVLEEATSALDAAGLAHVVFGSLATVALGRPRRLEPHEDVDLLIRPPDATAALAALRQAGFVPGEEDPSWIHKAKRLGVTVDLIHRAGREIHLDDEMLHRAVPAHVLDVPVRLMPAEDLAVIKAILHQEARQSDWFDALALVRRPDIDWDYLVRRARGHGAQRVLSLLLYARSDGAAVPARAIEELVEAVPG